MRRLGNAVVASFVVLLVAIAPVAAGGPPRTGEQINLFDPPVTVAANQPIWIGHGWCSTADDEDPLRSVVSPTRAITPSAMSAVFANSASA